MLMLRVIQTGPCPVIMVGIDCQSNTEIPVSNRSGQRITCNAFIPIATGNLNILDLIFCSLWMLHIIIRNVIRYTRTVNINVKGHIAEPVIMFNTINNKIYVEVICRCCSGIRRPNKNHRNTISDSMPLCIRIMAMINLHDLIRQIALN